MTSLLRHTALYGLARGGAGALSLAGIVALTRLLAPTDYGRYMLIMASVGLANMVCYQWMRVGLLRFFPASDHNPRPLLQTIAASFVLTAIVTGVVGVCFAAILPDPSWRPLILLAIPMLWASAWLDLTLESLRIQLRPVQYGLASWLKAALSLGIAVLLVYSGMGPAGPLLGIALGAALSAVTLGRREWQGVRLTVDPIILRRLLRYGLPLTAAYALGFVVSASDRFLIAWILGEGPSGIYAAGYDLSQQSLGLLAMIVTLSAYPLAVRALEKGSIEEVRKRLRENATFLLGLTLPAAIGMTILASNVVRVFLGSQFREEAAPLVPWIAIASVLASLQSYHFDTAFHLGRNTLAQLWVSASAAITNLVLNMILIPSFGMLGAAYATVAAYVVGLVTSIIIGRRVFPVGFPTPEVARIAVASGVMAAVLLPLRSLVGTPALVFQILVGIIAYGIAALGLNVANSRRWVMALLRR